MILVALAALGMGGYAQYRRLRRLGQEYRSRAANHDQRARYCASQLQNAETGLANAEEGLANTTAFRDSADTEGRRKYWAAYGDKYWKPTVAIWRRRVAGYRAGVDYHTGLSAKYRRAASRPWARVAADPPEPPEPALEPFPTAPTPVAVDETTPPPEPPRF
jgi:hypothetical protein